jgi:preprotein translocase subunit SecE
MSVAGAEKARSRGETNAMALMDQVRGFVKDVQVESLKVSWPTRNELRDSTIVVIVMVMIMTVFVYVADWLMRLLVGLLLR